VNSGKREDHELLDAADVCHRDDDMRNGEPPLIFNLDREGNEIRDELGDVRVGPERVGGKDEPADVNAIR
jgi:hypothetical protein